MSAHRASHTRGTIHGNERKKVEADAADEGVGCLSDGRDKSGTRETKREETEANKDEPLSMCALLVLVLVLVVVLVLVLVLA